MASPEDFPLVSGPQQLTDNWALTLPMEFRRRIEDGSLVFWRPGVTAWLNAYGAEDGSTVDERITRDRGRISPAATHLKDVRAEHTGALSYRLIEPREDGPDVASLYTLMHGPDGQIMMAIYYDSPETLALAEALAASLTYTGKPAT